MSNAKRELVCPNCFGTSAREVLATATSRNVVDDDSVPAPGSEAAAGIGANRRGDVVKLICNDCGHELTGNGRA